jgi:4-hydroxybenzoate polyprenyltransferase
MLVEGVLALLKSNPLYVFLLPLWLLKGKARFKREVAGRVDLDPALLPYHGPFLELLRGEKAAGRRLVLATAANERFAQRVAVHLGIFDLVLASDDKTNLSSVRKRDRLVDCFGDRGFDYAGNSRVDVPIWARARGALVVNGGPGVERLAAAVAPVGRAFERPPVRLSTYVRGLRIHQWVKNLLLFVPVAAAHRLLDLEQVAQAGIAFLAFGLCASSVYVLNDLLDLSADRQHPVKRHRPFAAGDLPVQQGLVLIPILLAGALVLASLLPPLFVAALGLYYGLTLAYSLRLKQVVLLDVLALAALYTLRIIAGGAATDTSLSFWLLAFSMFLFLSLALVKRYSELLLYRELDRESAAGRGYQTADLEMLAQFGITAGYLAVLVLALYIDSPAVAPLYAHPEALWLVCPVLLFWISRVWLLARRGELLEDPVVFAIQDRLSHALFLLVALCVWTAT